MTDPAPTVHRYLHDKCGMPGVPDPTAPSIDDRFAVGRCHSCTDITKKVKNPRGSDVLIREDLFNKEEWQVRTEKAELKRLVQQVAEYGAPTAKAAARLIELYDKYGFVGEFVVTKELRAYAASYEPPKKVSKSKYERSRGAQ